MDWLDWIFDTIADVFVDDDTLAQAAQAFEGGAFDMGGSEGFGGTTPLEIPDAVADAPILDAAADPALAAAPQPAPAPAAPAAVPVAQPVQATTGLPTPEQGAAAFAGGKAGGGIINNAATWFSKLSPGAQTVLAGGVVGGASALMQSLAQKNMLEDQEKREERAREDRARRSAVPAFGDGAFKPKGIIDSKRSGA